MNNAATVHLLWLKFLLIPERMHARNNDVKMVQLTFTVTEVQTKSGTFASPHSHNGQWFGLDIRECMLSTKSNSAWARGLR